MNKEKIFGADDQETRPILDTGTGRVKAATSGAGGVPLVFVKKVEASLRAEELVEELKKKDRVE